MIKMSYYSNRKCQKRWEERLYKCDADCECKTLPDTLKVTRANRWSVDNQAITNCKKAAGKNKSLRKTWCTHHSKSRSFSIPGITTWRISHSTALKCEEWMMNSTDVKSFHCACSPAHCPHYQFREANWVSGIVQWQRSKKFLERSRRNAVYTAHVAVTEFIVVPYWNIFTKPLVSASWLTRVQMLQP